MSDDVPRRLPRTQGQRVQNVARTHAAQSLGGATAAARPVQNTSPTPTIYKPPSGGSNVVTGESGVSSVAIESTVTGGAGAVHAPADQAVAIGYGALAGADNSVAIGFGETAAAARGGVAIGLNAYAGDGGAVAIGNSGTSGAVAVGGSSIAIGGTARANGANSVAIGNATAGDDQIVLGDGAHVVIVHGGLVLTDSAGGRWRLVVSTGGALSTVGYP